MNIYHFHPLTGEYLGQGLADADPLMSGNWLYPAFTTPTEPPTTPLGFYAQYQNDVWQLVAIPPEPEPVSYTHLTLPTNREV